jgi:pimeloyl-ACP methyl ester carboxylesterase
MLGFRVEAALGGRARLRTRTGEVCRTRAPLGGRAHVVGPGGAAGEVQGGVRERAEGRTCRLVLEPWDARPELEGFELVAGEDVERIDRFDVTPPGHGAEVRWRPARWATRSTSPGARVVPARPNRDDARVTDRTRLRAPRAAGLLLALPAACAAPGELSFPTEDGGVVFADAYGSGDRAVVLAHGGRFTRESWTDQAPRLARAGFLAVAIDFRGRGRSHGGAELGDEQGFELDVLAAVHGLRDAGAESVAVVGASFGGWTAGRAAAREPDAIDRLVLLGCGAVEPEGITCPTLYVVTEDDSRGEGELRLPGIRAAEERTAGPSELVVLPGSAHAQFVFETDQGERLLQEILRFLRTP